MEVIKRCLEENIIPHATLKKDSILKLVKLCLESTVFSFDNQLYKQIKGTPMGSPISVVIAEIVMQHVE